MEQRPLSSPFNLLLRRLANLLACDIAPCLAEHRHNIHSRGVGALQEPPSNQARLRLQKGRRRLRFIGINLSPDGGVEQLDAGKRQRIYVLLTIYFPLPSR